MAYWGAGGAGGWSGGGPGGGGNWANNLRPNSLQRSVDGWNDDELAPSAVLEPLPAVEAAAR